MADVAGTWNCVVNSPMGDQQSVLTVIPGENDSFTGTNSGAMGSLDVLDGKIDGNLLTWRMELKVPMPMTLECDAIIEGDTLSGGAKAGLFGTFPMKGTRA